MRAQAPGVRLRFVAETAADTPGLRRGEVDLEANANPVSAPDIRAEKVGESPLVIAVREGHPLTRVKTVTAKRYAEAGHISVSRRGNLGNAVDEALAQLGLTRSVVATAPTEAAAPDFMRGCDLVVCLPEATLRSAVADSGLAVLPVPLELPSAPIHLSWHQRHDTDRAHTWLRDLARAALTTRTTP